MGQDKSISTKLFKFDTYFNYLKSLFCIIFLQYYCKTDNNWLENIDPDKSTLDEIYRNALSSQLNLLDVHKNKITQIRGRLRRDKQYKQILKSLLFNSWVAECELNDPFNWRTIFFFDTGTEKDKLNLRRLYSNWKVSYIYYSTAKGVEALAYILSSKIPLSHTKLTESFYELVVKRALISFPFNISYDTSGLQTDRLKIAECQQIADYIGKSSDPFCKKFLSWALGGVDLYKNIEKWLRNRYNDRLEVIWRKRRDQYLQKKQKDPNTILIRPLKNQTKLSPYTLFHCFRDLREWATYREAEPFIYGAQADSTKFVLDISYCWIVAVFNLMIEAVVFNILPDDFIELSDSFVEDMVSHFEGTDFIRPIKNRHRILKSSS